MADPTFDQISASTLADMRDDIVYDEFFVESSLQRKLRASGALDVYTGGTVMQEPFQFDRVAGGAIAPGSDVTVIQKQILAATAFQPKEYLEQVPLNLWQTNVVNAGAAGKVKLADLYMNNAVQSLNTDLGIDFYRHGQAAPSGVGDNRLVFINGASEVMNDGVTNSWDGNYFPYYGGQARNGAIGNVLNSIPIWFGDQPMAILVRSRTSPLSRCTSTACNHRISGFATRRCMRICWNARNPNRTSLRKRMRVSVLLD